MKIIAITTPKVTDEDRYLIGNLLEMGIESVHLRKPESSLGACRELLASLRAEHRAKIVIHDYPELYEEFALKGIHINKNITRLPDGYQGFKSRSCHSFEEIINSKSEYDYLFLSPIFDSISKDGYRSAFHAEALQKASAEGIIDEKVIALGGVTLDKIADLKALNFGGVAMIGGLYNIEALERLKRIGLKL
uniref:thiamine phosphate synthase n=1 Tax=Alistipes sp. TaxID=1872444 RepID=UPI004056BB1B